MWAILKPENIKSKNKKRGEAGVFRSRFSQDQKVGGGGPSPYFYICNIAKKQ